MRRGGDIEGERENARRLLERGAGGVWGWDSPAGRRRVTARVRWLARACGMAPGLRVLECGCGTGIFTRRLAETGARITAVDVSDDLLAEAQRLCPAENVEFLNADLERPNDLADEGYDAICGVSVLHHLHLPQALSALHAKLRPGGRFAFSEPNLLNPINRHVIFTDDPAKRRRLGVSPGEMAFRPRELAEAFDRAGYVVETLAHRDFLHPSTPRWLIPVVEAGQFLAERAPLLRRWSGSLWVAGRRPEA